MNPGRMNRRVTIERLDTQVDPVSGEALQEYVAVRTVWCDVTQVNGRESFTSLQRYAEVSTRFRMRYAQDVNPEFTLLFDGRRYDIIGVLEIGRREGLDVLADARAEDGED